MFILPFLCPLKHAYEAYTTISQSLTVLNKEGKVEVISTEDLKKEPYCSMPRASERFQSFLDKNEIRKDLILAQEDLGLNVYMTGTNFFTRGIASITVPPFFKSVDEEACSFIFKHEVSHLKNNDAFTTSLVAAICSLASAIICTRRTSPILAFLVTLAVGALASILFTLYRENKADDFAIAHSSNEELKGGRRYFLSHQQRLLGQRTSLFTRLVYSSKGDFRLDLWHPSFTSRLKKVTRALEARGISVNELSQNEQENNNIKKLKDAYEEQLDKVQHHPLTRHSYEGKVVLGFHF